MTERTVRIGALQLDDGSTLPSVEQRVAMYGEPRRDGSNVVLVPHALTGSRRVVDWWPDIVGAGGLYDREGFCVVGIDALSAPGNVTVRDIVRAQQRALSAMRIERIATVIGGSLGGMQALQWALDAPERVGEAIVVGAHDHLSAIGIALNVIQRECIALDPVRGIRTARKLAMLTYKSEALLNERHGRNADRADPSRFDVEGYLNHQADIFERRMDPARYVALTKAMDSFDVRDARPTAQSPRLIFVGISSDWLFRACDVRAAAQRFASRGFRTEYIEMTSDHGHDAFLAEAASLARLLRPYTIRVA